MLAIALAAGLYMAWNIGANDVANAMGTSVGSGALTLLGAVLLAGIFEFLGATLVGTHVSETIRKGILETSLFQVDSPLWGPKGPRVLMLGMASALLAAGAWLQIATMFGLPVSTTHSIVGAVLGFGVVAAGWEAVAWGTVAKIVASWVISPILGGVLGAAMFLLVRRRILRQADPIAATRRLGPHLVAAVAFVLVLSLVYKGLRNVLSHPAWWMTVLVAAVVAGGAYAITRWRLRCTRADPDHPFQYVERVFGRLQIATACYVAFAHGANDVANAVGPLAAVIQIADVGMLPEKVPVPFWVLAVGAGGIVVGLATWGYKVIATIGKKITELTPTRGFSAEFGAATTVLIASRLGLPVSTTHTLVGAVIGVGLARGIGALNVRQVGRIANSWLATIPAAALFSSLTFLLLRAFLL
ncbi:MAG: inorganic phosphate transporter [Gemmatimonadota bacterium]